MTAYYAIFDVEGKPAAFYCSDVNKTVSSSAKKITKEEYDKYVTGKYYRNLETGVCTELPSQSAATILKNTIEFTQMRFNSDLTKYINSHYDVGTQISFQALYILDSTPQEVKNGILAIWNWIKNVMAYYYSRKAAIGELPDVNSVLAATWNFSQFETSVPALTLRDIYSMI